VKKIEKEAHTPPIRPEVLLKRRRSFRRREEAIGRRFVKGRKKECSSCSPYAGGPPKAPYGVPWEGRVLREEQGKILEEEV